MRSDDKKEKAIGAVLGIVLLLGAVAVLSLFAGAVMRVLGFAYESVGSIVLFFLIAAVISCPLGLFAAVPKALMRLGKLKKPTAIMIYIVFDTTITAAALFFVDSFMESVSASSPAILTISFLLSLPEAWEMKQENL